MRENEDDEARPTDLIVDIYTGETVGVNYVWENGARQTLWLNGEQRNVTFIALEKSTTCEVTD